MENQGQRVETVKAVGVKGGNRGDGDDVYSNGDRNRDFHTVQNVEEESRQQSGHQELAASCR